jgi:hypothetical protein
MLDENHPISVYRTRYGACFPLWDVMMGVAHHDDITSLRPELKNEQH